MQAMGSLGKSIKQPCVIGKAGTLPSVRMVGMGVSPGWMEQWGGDREMGCVTGCGDHATSEKLYSALAVESRGFNIWNGRWGQRRSVVVGPIGRTTHFALATSVIADVPLDSDGWPGCLAAGCRRHKKPV